MGIAVQEGESFLYQLYMIYIQDHTAHKSSSYVPIFLPTLTF